MMRTSSPHSTVSWAALLGLALLVPSCGDSAKTTDTIVSENPNTADGQSGELKTLFESQEVAVNATVKDNLERRNAVNDGWPSELLHDTAKHQLKDLFHDLLDLNKATADLHHFLADDYSGCNELRPAGLKEVFSDSDMKVMRPDALATALLPAADFDQQCSNFRKPFTGADHLKADLKIVSVDREGDETFSTKMLVQAHGRRDGAALQTNIEWRVQWRGLPEDEHPKIRSIVVLSYEEFSAPQAMFADLTGHAFGEHEFFLSEFQRGAGDLYRQKDRLTGNSYMGWQGIAVGDVNNDGMEDLYVCQPGGLPNRLFLKQADGTTKEVAKEWEVAYMDNSRAALILDFDNDGNLDLAVSMGPGIAVKYNNGKGIFGQLTLLSCPGSAFVHSISATDIDQDGDLEIYACRYNRHSEAGSLGGGLPVPYHDANNGGRNILFLNEGRANPMSVGRFRDATVEYGLDVHNLKFSLASIWEDFDNDGDTDLYVTNDFGRNNYYRNDDGRYTDVADEIGLGELAASMGASAADFDQDGDVDIYLSNMFSSAGLRIVTQDDKFMSEERDRSKDFISHARGNFLLENSGDGKFKDVTDSAGVSLGRWTWGARFVDFNNDGFDDLYVPNGFITGPDTGDL